VHNLYFHGYWIFKNYSSELPVCKCSLFMLLIVAECGIERYSQVQPIDNETGFKTLYRGNFKVDMWEIAASGSQNFFDVLNQSIPVLGTGVSDKSAGLGTFWFTHKKFRYFVLKVGLESL
jgi:hypothetical protein